MSRYWVFALMLVPGCYIESYEGGGGPLDDSEGSSDCTTKQPTKSAGTTGATDGGSSEGGSCKAHADCGAGAFCLFGSGECTPAKSCAVETDCIAGFNCDTASKSCLPSDSETCGELGNEAACVGRNDCAPSYAGVDCSCGPDCKCVGGEPGCVCAGFEFFRCEPVLP